MSMEMKGKFTVTPFIPKEVDPIGRFQRELEENDPILKAKKEIEASNQLPLIEENNTMNTKTREDHANDIRARRNAATNKEKSTMNDDIRNLKASARNLFGTIFGTLKDPQATGRTIQTAKVRTVKATTDVINNTTGLVKKIQEGTVNYFDGVNTGMDTISPERIEKRNAKAEAKARAKAEAADDESDLSAEDLKELDDLCNS